MTSCLKVIQWFQRRFFTMTLLYYRPLEKAMASLEQTCIPSIQGCSVSLYSRMFCFPLFKDVLYPLYSRMFCIPSIQGCSVSLYSRMFCFPLFKDVLFPQWVWKEDVFKLVNVLSYMSLFSPHEKKVS